MKATFMACAALAMMAAGAQAQAPTMCALQEPETPTPRGFGTVLEIQNTADAHADIPTREAIRGGAIDPLYLNDARVVVKQDNGTVDTYDVPAGLTAHVGDRVKLQGSYRSAHSACSYVPILAIPKEPTFDSRLIGDWKNAGTGGRQLMPGSGDGS